MSPLKLLWIVRAHHCQLSDTGGLNYQQLGSIIDPGRGGTISV